MNMEQLEIRDFVGTQRPFDRLPQEALVETVAGMTVRYVRRGTTVPEREKDEPALSLIRSGAVELHDGQELLARLGEGDLLGYRASLHRSEAAGEPVALEDTLLYRLPASAVDRLCQAHPSLAWFLAPAGGTRLREAVRHVDHR